MITNDIISECSQYTTCRELWERNDRDGRIMLPFTCKECIGYECYWRGYNDGIKEKADDRT